MIHLWNVVSFALFSEIECPCSSESPQREKTKQERGRIAREVIKPSSYALQVRLQSIQGARNFPALALWPVLCYYTIRFRCYIRYNHTLKERTKCVKKIPNLKSQHQTWLCSANKQFHVLHSCGICKKNQDQHLLLLCDTCKLHYHLGCLDPPLTRMPKKTKNSYWWEQNRTGRGDWIVIKINFCILN